MGLTVVSLVPPPLSNFAKIRPEFHICGGGLIPQNRPASNTVSSSQNYKLRILRRTASCYA